MNRASRRSPGRNRSFGGNCDSASGDLTPLAYVATCLAGEGVVQYRGDEIPTAAAFEREGLRAIVLRPKEALAVMNGTAVMTGLGALAFRREDPIQPAFFNQLWLRQ